MPEAGLSKRTRAHKAVVLGRLRSHRQLKVVWTRKDAVGRDALLLLVKREEDIRLQVVEASLQDVR